MLKIWYFLLSWTRLASLRKNVSRLKWRRVPILKTLHNGCPECSNRRRNQLKLEWHLATASRARTLAARIFSFEKSCKRDERGEERENFGSGILGKQKVWKIEMQIQSSVRDKTIRCLPSMCNDQRETFYERREREAKHLKNCSERIFPMML